jgi:N-methylhydantoinase A
MRIGIDIGGTFTDIVCIEEDGTVTTRKVSSSVDDYSRSISETLPEILQACRIDGSAVREIIHGTTVATNAILEQRGAKTSLITTKGFRDVLELRRIRMPELYNWDWDKPPDLVERRFRREVCERIDARGEIIAALDLSQAGNVVDEILADGTESVAVCLINSYINPVHEQAIRDLLRTKRQDLPVSISSEILREVKEYERTATVVVNAYVLPLVRKYVEALDRCLQGAGIQAPLLIMQSNGGVMTAKECSRKPVFMIESGPAAGVISAHGLATRTGIENAITFDMGGTTTKASIMEAQQISTASEYEVGSSLSLVSRLIKGGGHLIRIPAIDVAEIGAGGGSVAWLDAGGALRVGPRSSGSKPGPVCYDQGGTEVTITDANLLLGYINDQGLAGGGIHLNRAKAEQAFREQIAEPLGLDICDAAYGVHLLANSSMMRALRSVSTERGRDARHFVLIAFGGSGPLHASGIVRTLEMNEAIIPANAGLFSAFGLLSADLEHHVVQTYYKGTRQIDLEKLNAMLLGMEEHVSNLLRNEGYFGTQVEIARHVDLRYQGQSYELTLPLPFGPLDWGSIATLEGNFDEEHEKTYGHRASVGEGYLFVNFRLTGKIRRHAGSAQLSKKNSDSHRRQRNAYFGNTYKWKDTPVLFRSDLTEIPKRGPILIDEYDTTTVVPPDCSAWLDSNGSVHIQVGGRHDLQQQ